MGLCDMIERWFYFFFGVLLHAQKRGLNDYDMKVSFLQSICWGVSRARKPGSRLGYGWV